MVTMKDMYDDGAGVKWKHAKLAAMVQEYNLR